ncbi:MAG: carboxypeptidase-like regulatory domain-containing protein, partial [Chitinophagia bacterium]|nr:carboxypeptidase-like regulatory domain-containing protein [Chitinophagia bacterium]
MDSVPKPTVPDTTKAYSTQPNDPLTAKHITLTGKVEDNNTLEGLSFAVVIFPHTIIGATTDIDGFFTLTIDSLPSDTLSIQAMGYKNAYYKITASALSRPITIEMERNLSELKEVTVRSSSVDPAQALMKRIIARKPANNPDRFENYSYEVHTRLEADLQRMSKEQFLKIPLLKNYSFIFDNIDSVSDTKPFLPLYLTETISDFYYRKSPLKQREIIKASIVKGLNNENFVKYLNTLYVKLNIYNNYISIFNKKFISPLHGSSGLYYKYTIQDTAYRNGHRLFHVRFSPRRVGEYCFVGDF